MTAILETRHANAPSVQRYDRETKRHHRLVQVERIPQASDLQHEIDEIIQRGETGMYLLPGTGFQVKSQIDLLIENYENNIPLSSSLQQLEQDVQGFKIEYLTELPVFPILLEKKNEAGRRFLTGKLYGGRSFADGISENERDGVVKKSAQKIEEILLDAAPGTMVVMTSPKGWSGYQSRDNRLEKLNPLDTAQGLAAEIRYPDSQTYCYQVMPDGSIKGFTLKTDMTLSQNKKLLMELRGQTDVFEEVVDFKTDIKWVVENVVVIDPEKKESIEGIAQKIQEIKGLPVAYRDSTGTSRYFSEMIDLLQHPEDLWTLDEAVKSEVDPLLAYVSKRITDSDTQKRTDLETALGLVILKIMDKVRPRKKDTEMKQGTPLAPSRAQEFSPLSPQDRLEELQRIGGCAGGGNNKNKFVDPIKQVINSLTPRLGSKSIFEDEDQEWFTCPKCSYKADGPVGNQCPGCNLTKEEFAAEEGAVVCD